MQGIAFQFKNKQQVLGKLPHLSLLYALLKYQENPGAS